jgi:hypothetical protein
MDGGDVVADAVATEVVQSAPGARYAPEKVSNYTASGILGQPNPCLESAVAGSRELILSICPLALV